MIIYRAIYNDKNDFFFKQIENKRDPKPLVQFTLYFHFDRFMFHDTWRPAHKLAFTRQPFNPRV